MSTEPPIINAAGIIPGGRKYGSFEELVIYPGLGIHPNLAALYAA
jgi:hypothetical protein